MKINYGKKMRNNLNVEKHQFERTVSDVIESGGKGRRKLSSVLSMLLMFFVFFSFVGCHLFNGDDTGENKIPIKLADGNKPTKITSFTPDSGGIAVPMIISGENFGTDTANLSVLFVSELKDKNGVGTGKMDTVKGSIVTSNGEKIYLMVPKLTYKDNLEIWVKTKTDKGEERETTISKRFHYKTETTVTTVAGRFFEKAETAVTQGGTLSSCSFSGPMFLCVDSLKNVLVVERLFNKGGVDGGALLDESLHPKTTAGKTMNGCFLLLNEKENRVDFMQEAKLINAPTINPTGSTIYIPTDDGADFYILNADENYSPRLKTLRPSGEAAAVLKNNWKFSFVTRKSDGMLFTVMFKGQVLMINPRTRKITILCSGYNFGASVENGDGTDNYLMFDPNDEKVLYSCSAGSHSIFKIRLTKKDVFDNEGNKTGEKDTVNIKPWAGGMADGLSSGESKGWADAGLKKARFCYPRQITFDKNAVMYIADSGNHCIRTIDTKLSDDVATVKTLIGKPNEPGNVDGGPDIAQFKFPMGIAVARDETIYIADTRNHIIRKLAVQ